MNFIASFLHFVSPILLAALVIGSFAGYFVYCSWHQKRSLKKLPQVQPDLTGERLWDAERKSVLNLIEVIRTSLEEAEEALKTSGVADCGHVLLEVLPNLAVTAGERYCKIISQPDSLNVGIWFMDSKGEWHRSLDETPQPVAISVLGRRIMLQKVVRSGDDRV